jgi:YVTN family beta-propeller protein
VVFAAAGVAAVLAGEGYSKPTAPLFARPDSLVRIDPATHKVSAIIDVGSHPVVVAAGGHSVWVYNKYDEPISEVDARTNRIVRTATIPGSPAYPCCSLFTGRCLPRMRRVPGSSAVARSTNLGSRTSRPVGAGRGSIGST